MSPSSRSISHRYAIWEAYGYKCCYCKEQLPWDGLEIDHVLPKSLLKLPPAELVRKLATFGLNSDFDLQSDFNLVPACHKCNNRKRDRKVEINQAIIFIREISAKVPVIGILRKRNEEKQQSNIFRAKLEMALAAGMLTQQQVLAAISSSSPSKDSQIKLALDLDFFDGASINELSPSDVDTLLDAPIKLGANLPEGLRLVAHDRTERHVRTCREYRDATAAGYYAGNNFEHKMSGFFVKTLGILESLGACRPSAKSYLSSPRIGICDVDLLPSMLLPILGDSGAPGHEIKQKHPTIGDVVRAGEARIQGVGSDILDLDFHGLSVRLREVLRSDLDGDGVEDLLIIEYAHAIGGTFSYVGEPIALTSKGIGQVLQKTKIKGPHLHLTAGHEEGL